MRGEPGGLVGNPSAEPDRATSRSGPGPSVGLSGAFIFSIVMKIFIRSFVSLKIYLLFLEMCDTLLSKEAAEDERHAQARFSILQGGQGIEARRRAILPVEPGERGHDDA